MIDQNDDTQRIFLAYKERSHQLQNWLVAFGVGVPALFITQERAWDAVRQSGLGVPLAAMFFSGAFLQVGYVLALKHYNYFGYMSCSNSGLGHSSTTRVWMRFRRTWQIDLFIDCLSALLLLSASVLSAFIMLRYEKPNKAPEPTPTAVTSPAAQEPRQP